MRGRRRRLVCRVAVGTGSLAAVAVVGGLAATTLTGGSDAIGWFTLPRRHGRPAALRAGQPQRPAALSTDSASIRAFAVISGLVGSPSIRAAIWAPS